MTTFETKYSISSLFLEQAHTSIATFRIRKQQKGLSHPFILKRSVQPLTS